MSLSAVGSFDDWTWKTYANIVINLIGILLVTSMLIFFYRLSGTQHEAYMKELAEKEAAEAAATKKNTK